MSLSIAPKHTCRAGTRLIAHAHGMTTPRSTTKAAFLSTTSATPPNASAPVLPVTAAAAHPVTSRPKAQTRSDAPTQPPKHDLGLRPSKPLKRQQLVDLVHRGVFPHLYEADGTAKEEIKQWPGQEMVDRNRAKKRERVRWFARVRKANLHPSRVKQPPLKPIQWTCPFPLKTHTDAQLAILDPTSSRTRLFSPSNPEAARPGDVLLVRLSNGDPFSGVLISHRRAGIDSSILLRNQLTRVGVEMSFKIYSPAVEGIEVVQRAERRARRKRVTYVRTKKHDRGSVDQVVRTYLRQKAALGVAGAGKAGGDAGAAQRSGAGRAGKAKKR